MGTLQRTAAAVLAGVLLLSGCVQPRPTPPSPDPTDSSAPVFESEEEALAAAEAAYAEYLAVGDQIASEGGEGLERLRPLIHPAYWEEETAVYQDLTDAGLRTTGVSSFDTVSLQQYTESPGRVLIDIYVCLDVSEIRVLDAQGNDATSPTRPERLPLEVGLENLPGAPEVLLIGRSDVWQGDDFCAA